MKLGVVGSSILVLTCVLIRNTFCSLRLRHRSNIFSQQPNSNLIETRRPLTVKLTTPGQDKFMKSWDSRQRGKLATPVVSMRLKR